MNAVVWKWLTLGLVAAVVSGAFWLAGALREPPRSSGLQVAFAAPNEAVVQATSPASHSSPLITSAATNDTPGR